MRERLRRDDLRDLIETTLTVPFMTALDAFSIGETAGRKALKRGDLPFRVVRVGSALRVPTVDLAVLLGVPTPDDTASGPKATTAQVWA